MRSKHKRWTTQELQLVRVMVRCMEACALSYYQAVYLLEPHIPQASEAIHKQLRLEMAASRKAGIGTRP